MQISYHPLDMLICCRALSAAAIQPWTGEQVAQRLLAASMLQALRRMPAAEAASHDGLPAMSKRPGLLMAQHSAQVKPPGRDKSGTKSAVQATEVGRSVQAAYAILQGREAGQRGLLLSLMHQGTAETGPEHSAGIITLPSASSR